MGLRPAAERPIGISSWIAYADYSKVGYISGAGGGPAAGAALLLLVG